MNTGMNMTLEEEVMVAPWLTSVRKKRMNMARGGRT